MVDVQTIQTSDLNHLVLQSNSSHSLSRVSVVTENPHVMSRGVGRTVLSLAVADDAVRPVLVLHVVVGGGEAGL